jgi:aspartokinase/homoserine dehydrogenase 1
MPGKSSHAPFVRLSFRVSASRSQQDAIRVHHRAIANAPLSVMKFGGTSVGDAPCIQRLTEIVRDHARASRVAVVVSAMSGVTNKLIEASAQAAAGNAVAVAAIFDELRGRHDQVIHLLIPAGESCSALSHRLSRIFKEGESLCQGVILSRNLTAETRDAIASLGERLAAPIVATALNFQGVISKAIEATDLIVTDANFGSADPCADATRRRCEARLAPLLHQNVIPVITGFIGATPDGRLTTLGRGGSDYSATILGAALGASEVIIWTDVDGVLTADPRLVPSARTIPELSYREAAGLAHFGAKVLHPKTLRPLSSNGIPVWIRNSFSSQHPGTKITVNPPASRSGVVAVAALKDMAFITVTNAHPGSVPSLEKRLSKALSSTRTDTFFFSQCCSETVSRFVVPASHSVPVTTALQQEFAAELDHGLVEPVRVDLNISMITLVGRNLCPGSRVVESALDALRDGRLDIIAMAHGNAGGTASIVVSQENMSAAFETVHRELEAFMEDSNLLAGDNRRAQLAHKCEAD